jgi:hypothetical protein
MINPTNITIRPRYVAMLPVKLEFSIYVESEAPSILSPFINPSIPLMESSIPNAAKIFSGLKA